MFVLYPGEIQIAGFNEKSYDSRQGSSRLLHAMHHFQKTCGFTAKGQAHPSVWSIRVHLVGGVPYQSLGHKQGRCPISKVNPVSMSG